MKRLIQTGCLLILAGTCIFIGNKQTNEDILTATEVVETIQEEPLEVLGEPIVFKFAMANSEFIPEEDTVPEEIVTEEEIEETDEEYSSFAISNVTGYVNVRQGPSTDDKILGKMYNGSVAQILEMTDEDEPWLKIRSGSVEGYIKAEYFIYGEDAVEVMEEYVTKVACVTASRLNVRKEPDLNAKRIGYLEKGEKAKLIHTQDGWYQVEYGEEKVGYISAEYAFIEEEYATAISLEEERLQRQLEKEMKEREQKQEENAPEDTKREQTTPVEAIVSTSDIAVLRQQIIDFAMQYLGNPYVHGGNSLDTGTDCSGFTSLIYKEFGYSLTRTPGGQLSSSGTLIDISQIQVGDIVCYGKKGGKCTHVAIYAGDDKIIHSSTPKSGVVIGKLYYDNILGIKNILD